MRPTLCNVIEQTIVTFLKIIPFALLDKNLPSKTIQRQFRFKNSASSTEKNCLGTLDENVCLLPQVPKELWNAFKYVCAPYQA